MRLGEEREEEERQIEKKVAKVTSLDPFNFPSLINLSWRRMYSGGPTVDEIDEVEGSGGVEREARSVRSSTSLLFIMFFLFFLPTLLSFSSSYCTGVYFAKLLCM